MSNAGITRDGLLLRMSEDDFTGVIDANLTAAFRVAKRAAQGMLRARWGRIIFMSSVVGLLGSAGQANYAASKAGPRRPRPLARPRAGSRSITVNVVAPGPVATDMTAALGEKRLAELDRRRPARAHGRRPTRSPASSPSWRPTTPPTSPAPSSPSTAGSAWATDARRATLRCPPQAARTRPTPPSKEHTVDQELFARFKKCAVEVLSVPEDKVDAGGQFGDDLDADSLDLVELVMALEEEFDIEVPEEELEGIETVGQAYDLVAGKLLTCDERRAGASRSPGSASSPRAASASDAFWAGPARAGHHRRVVRVESPTGTRRRTTTARRRRAAPTASSSSPSPPPTEAFAQAGSTLGVDPARFGTIFGTGVGGLHTLEEQVARPRSRRASGGCRRSSCR